MTRDRSTEPTGMALREESAKRAADREERLRQARRLLRMGIGPYDVAKRLRMSAEKVRELAAEVAA
jgi:hypothetical protein